MHSAGLAHSDLSYKNVLIDPVSRTAAIIDIDGLVVPGKFPPDVIGTADFIAPEVLATKHLNKTDQNRKLPNRTDRFTRFSSNDLYVSALQASVKRWKDSRQRPTERRGTWNGCKSIIH